MALRYPLVVDEWYHCYNRGVDRRIIFGKPSDYKRFMALLYLCNGTKTVHISNFVTKNTLSFLADQRIDRGEPIVEIGAYALMPNHIHLVLQEIRESGIATFMQRIGTAYTMYFNKSMERTGALFSGPYKSKHVHDDRYLKQVVPYVLLNPAELFDTRWKRGQAIAGMVRKRLIQYEYSSLPDFIGVKRAANAILGQSLKTYYDNVPSLDEMIAEAQAYYREIHQGEALP